MLRRGSSELYSTPRFVYPRQAACSRSRASASPMLRSICSTASVRRPVRANATPSVLYACTRMAAASRARSGPVAPSCSAGAAAASARSAQAIAPALSPARNASRPISWKDRKSVVVGKECTSRRAPVDCREHLGTEAVIDLAGGRGVVRFFFQADVGIRDVAVTGVQTCALPIYAHGGGLARPLGPGGAVVLRGRRCGQCPLGPGDRAGVVTGAKRQPSYLLERSEERRCRERVYIPEGSG